MDALERALVFVVLLALLLFVGVPAIVIEFLNNRKRRQRCDD